MVLVVWTVLFKSTFHVFFLAFLLFVYFCFISFPSEYVYIQQTTKEQSLHIQKKSIYPFLPPEIEESTPSCFQFLVLFLLWLLLVFIYCCYPLYLPPHTNIFLSLFLDEAILFSHFFFLLFSLLVIWRLLCSSFFFVLLDINNIDIFCLLSRSRGTKEV